MPLNRTVLPGGFEGWSFSLNATAETNPKPRVSPVRAVQPGDPAPPPVAPTPTPTTGPTTQPGPDQAPTKAPTTKPGKGVGKDQKGKGAPSRNARLATAWLIRELRSGGMPAPTPTTADPVDWGLTLDVLFALHATGTGQRAATRIVAAADEHAGDYLGVRLYADRRARRAGQTAKLLLAATVAGKDPRSFGRVMRADGSLAAGRYDLRAETLSLIGRSGRLSDRGVSLDNTNVFSQSLAVLGLARSGGVGRRPVRYLVRQQCAAGYFRMFDRTGRSCDRDRDAADTDGTAMAIQALLSARDSGVTGLDAPLKRATSWLRGRQRPDGSFGGGVSTEAPNSNSTGLAAQALAATGQTKAARRAAAYVGSLVVTPARATGRLSAETGAIAYNAAAMVTARTQGITGRDQWRRAGAQAILALAPTPLTSLGGGSLRGNPTLDAAAPTYSPVPASFPIESSAPRGAMRPAPAEGPGRKGSVAAMTSAAEAPVIESSVPHRVLARPAADDPSWWRGPQPAYVALGAALLALAFALGRLGRPAPALTKKD